MIKKIFYKKNVSVAFSQSLFKKIEMTITDREKPSIVLTYEFEDDNEIKQFITELTSQQHIDNPF